jgi:hypothetical protein
MPSTYDKIDKYTVTGSNLLGTTGVTFTSIPSTYTDLVLVQDTTLTAAAIAFLQVNSDTGSNYSRTTLSGNGTSAASSRQSSQTQISTDVVHMTSTRGTYILNFQNYSNSTTYKTVLIRNNNTAFGTEATVGLWRNTAAITSIKCYLDRAESYVVGSTFTLYGIKAA